MKKRRPGQVVADRGCAPARPWHSDALQTDIENLVAFVANTNSFGPILGVDFRVRIDQPSDRVGFSIHFERTPYGVSGS
jgi:hypothetical protein